MSLFHWRLRLSEITLKDLQTVTETIPSRVNIIKLYTFGIHFSLNKVGLS